MARRWPLDGRRHKAESLFFVFATLFLCWSFAALLHLTSGDFGDGVLRGLMPTGTIFASLLNFVSKDDGALTDLSHRIYVVEDPAVGTFAVSDWNQLSKKWDSKSSYADLLNATQTTVEILPSMEPKLHSERVIFILHNHPKMASTTLRRACWENLRLTCDVVSHKRDPMGYSNTKDLAALIEKCKNTHHFCVMGWHFHPNNFPNVTSVSSQPTTFIHMFPYRNFHDWAVSAMKQVFVGHSEAGCNAVSQRLEKCDGWLELDFTKYSKRAMSQMLGIIKPQRQQSATHHLLLYDFSGVHTTLAQLSRLYQVPILPYLDMQYKQTRQDGTCSNETLKTFHECFDEQLMEL